MTLEIGAEEVAITHNWHCFFRNELSEGDGRFHKNRYASHSGKFVMREIGSDGLLFFPPPDCEATNDFYPTLTLARSVSRPAAIEFYDRQRNSLDGYRVRIKKSVVRHLDGSADDSAPTKEQIRRILELDTNSRGFQTVEARIWPEAEWKKSQSLSTLLQDKVQFTTASKEPQKPNVPVGYAWFPSSDVRKVPETLVKIPMRKTGSVWKMGPADPDAALVAYAVDSTRDDVGKGYSSFNRPAAHIEYDGHEVIVDRFCQSFDPSKRIIVDFINDYRAKPWLEPGRVPKG